MRVQNLICLHSSTAQGHRIVTSEPRAQVMRVLRNSGRVSWRSMLKQLPQQVDLQRLLPIQRCRAS